MKPMITYEKPFQIKKTVHIIEAELSLVGHRLKNVHYFHLVFFFPMRGRRQKQTGIDDHE